MKFKSLSALCLSLAILPASAATIAVTDYNQVLNNPDLTILDFESGSTGVPTPSDIQVSSSMAADWYQISLPPSIPVSIPPYFTAQEQAIFGEQFLGNTSEVPRHSDIAFNLHTPTNFVGAWIMPASLSDTIQTIELSLYDNNDQLIVSKSLSSPQDLSGKYFFGLYSDSLISRVVWHPVEDSFFRIDNLAYGLTTSPVPLPASAYLFLSAMIGLVVKTKANRRQ